MYHLGEQHGLHLKQLDGSALSAQLSSRERGVSTTSQALKPNPIINMIHESRAVPATAQDLANSNLSAFAWGFLETQQETLHTSTGTNQVRQVFRYITRPSGTQENTLKQQRGALASRLRLKFVYKSTFRRKWLCARNRLGESIVADNTVHTLVIDLFHFAIA